MPVEQSPPVLFGANLQEEPFRLADTNYPSDYALEVVNTTFWQYELFRVNNHDRRWNVSDSLYYAYVPPRVWDGTSVSRASLSMPIVFDQVEAALPAISQAIFNVGPDWFQVEPEPGTDPAEARQKQDSLSYQLEHPKDDVGSSTRAEIEIAIKSVLLYGNGGISVEYDAVLQRAVVSAVDIRDIYIDPGLDIPNVDCSRSLIRRRMMTVQELYDLKSDPRMKIPSLDILWYMAKNIPQQMADQTKRVQEAIRGVYYSPGYSDFIPLPSAQKVEVLMYYTKDRIIWVLNKQWVAYNGPNPYGFIPFAFAPCYIVPHRFYAMSIADVQENNQRYIEALINGRLDEISLIIHPPRVQTRAALMTPAQQRWRPGAVYTANNKDDITVLQQQSALQNVYTEIQYLESAAEKRTGISSLSSGIPRPSNANRTLGGMQTQMQGSANRLTYIISNIEMYMLVPMLYKLDKILSFHTRPGQAIPATSEGKNYRVDAQVLQKSVRYRMLAASRMLTRNALMQAFPMLAQFLLQGPMLQELGKTGQTIDFGVLMQMAQDATGTASMYKLIRPLSQQEQQAMQQPSPADQQKMQLAQLDAQTRNQIMDKKVQGDLQKEQVKKQSNPMEIMAEQQARQQEMQQMQQEMQMDAEQRQQEMKMEAIMQQIKIAAEQKKHELNIAGKQADLQIKQQTAAQQIQQQQLEHAMGLQQMQQEGQQNQQFAEDKHGLMMQQMKEKAAMRPSGQTGSNSRQPRKKEGTRTKTKAPTS